MTFCDLQTIFYVCKMNIVMDKRDEITNKKDENKDEERIRKIAKMILANNKVVFDRLAEI